LIEPHIDAAIFFAIYLGIVGVVFAMGEPQDRRESRIRAVTLVFCAVLAVVMIMWVVLGVLDRVLG
jgi:hypothetical protein